MGPSQEDATKGGVRSCRLGKVLPHGDTGGVIVWGGDLVVFVPNGAEAGESSCEVPDKGENVEGKKAERRIMAEGGGGQRTLGSGDTTALDLLVQEAGGIGGMGGLTSYL